MIWLSIGIAYAGWLVTAIGVDQSTEAGDRWAWVGMALIISAMMVACIS